MTLHPQGHPHQIEKQRYCRTFCRSVTGNYDPAGQLETGTGVTYSYDKLGERTNSTPTSGPATTYSYDQAGKLVSVSRPAEGEVPAIAETMTYDATGLLASKTGGLATQHLTWDQSAQLPLLLADGENSYVHGPNGLPVEQISSGEEPTYLHHDQLTSTRMLTDAAGSTSATFSYTTYGGLEGKMGTAAALLGFAGQYTDAETGLQYLRARFYDPATAQFLTRDPVVEFTRTPYSYASDSPLTYSDPSGLFWGWPPKWLIEKQANGQSCSESDSSDETKCDLAKAKIGAGGTMLMAPGFEIEGIGLGLEGIINAFQDCSDVVGPSGPGGLAAPPMIESPLLSLAGAVG